jgi:hypothetical protein
MDAPRIVIDMCDPEVLLGRICLGQAADKEAACLVEPG